MMKEKLLEKFQDVYAWNLWCCEKTRGQENKGLFHEHGGRDSGDCDWRLSSSE